MVEFECGPINLTTRSGLNILQDIHIKLSSPVMVVINGPSGSGKTSLLRAVAGLNRADVALRRLNGQSFDERGLPSWRAKVTLLLQDAPCLEGSILMNLAFPYGFKNARGRPFSKGQAREIIAQVRLGHIPLDADVSRLSGGERHRLGLARGMMWAPPVLMADEPLSGLEPELAARCFGLLCSYARERNSIVICVLHQERFAKRADQWLRLEDGRLYRVNAL